jgi:hypothetical protein
VRFDADRVEISLAGERHVHFQAEPHWQMEMTAGEARSTIELTGWTPGHEPGRADRAAKTKPLQAVRRAARPPIRLPRTGLAAFDLGEGNYRRSEETWDEAGRPSARVTVGAGDSELVVEVSIVTDQLVFVPEDAANPYDNEHPDINGHGVQLYVRTHVDGGAWMIVPDSGSPEARVRPLEGWGALAVRSATWSRTVTGFSVRVRVGLPPLPAGYPAGAYPVSIDVLVNESAPGRARRRGQLVLSGAQGEFVYLRGDRHDPSRLVPLMILD